MSISPNLQATLFNAAQNRFQGLLKSLSLGFQTAFDGKLLGYQRASFLDDGFGLGQSLLGLQPRFVPVSLSWSRMTVSSVVAGLAMTLRGTPLTVKCLTVNWANSEILFLGVFSSSAK